MPEKTPLTDLQSKALETAQRFEDYGSYGGRESRAVAALHRRCPGWDKEDCRSWFVKALAVHKSGIPYMNARAEEATEIWRKSRGHVDLSPIADEFIKQHSEFRKEELLLTLFRILDWHLLR